MDNIRICTREISVLFLIIFMPVPDDGFMESQNM